MNPNSQEAAAKRAELHQKAIADRAAILAQVRANPGRADLERALHLATSRVRGGLARMEAMGDALPEQSTPSVSTSPLTAPSPPRADCAPVAARAAPLQPEPAADPIVALVARILKA